VSVVAFYLQDSASVDQFLQAIHLDIIGTKGLNMLSQILNDCIDFLLQQDAFGLVIGE